jgi:cation diffusion facilitator CzcD-associated flavoprotein CzcO
MLISATGQLNRPVCPDIPGLTHFAGKVFHLARWDNDYDLRGKRAALIGTGTSAIQFIPELVRKAAGVHLFQRSPAYVMPAGSPLLQVPASALRRRAV